MSAPIRQPKPKTKSNKPIDWPAVVMRAARHGLQIISIDHADWQRTMGTDARIVLDGTVLWLCSCARIHDLEVALLEADCLSHPPYYVRPKEVVEIGGAKNQRGRVLRRTPRSQDVEELLGELAP